MRKKITISLMMTMFFCCGVSVIKANGTFNNTSPTFKKFSDLNLSNYDLINKKILTLNQECLLAGPACDNALRYANILAGNAATTCRSNGWESQSCTTALDNATAAAHEAYQVCKDDVEMLEQ